MLSPEYLRRITEGSEQIAEELHQYIISEIVSRMMARIGRGEDYILTSADAWRIRTLQESGELLEDILAELSKYTKRQQEELKEAFEDAGITALDYDDKIYKAAGLSPVPLEQSPYMIRLMERNMLATMGEWRNFTRTTANAAQTLYINQCDTAYNQVMSGAVGYTQAIKQAVNNIVSSGVVVQYPSGRKDTIETAVARSVRTGVAQTTGDISIRRMEEMNWDIILVSAHVGARTGDGGENPGNHSWWQGKFYSKSGKDKRFLPFSVTGYGTASGLCGANCRHSFGAGDGEFNPYEELSKQDKQTKGEQYEKEQKQRTYERRIRRTKREVIGMQAAVDACQDEQAKFELQQELDRKSYLLQKQNSAYKDYCKDNNLRELQDRLMIAKWNRQNAAKARGAARRYKAAKGENT